MTQQFEPFQKVLVRDRDDQPWRASMFSHMDYNVAIHKFVCINAQWKHCIPFEGHQHLLGTSDGPTPPEPEFRFGDKVEVSDGGHCWVRGVFLRYYAGSKYRHCVYANSHHEESSWVYCRKADW